MTIHSSSATLSRLEWKVTLFFLFGSIPLLLIPLPLFIFYYSFYYFNCNHKSSALINVNRLEVKETCDGITWLIPYMFYILPYFVNQRFNF